MPLSSIGFRLTTGVQEARATQGTFYKEQLCSTENGVQGSFLYSLHIAVPSPLLVLSSMFSGCLSHARYFARCGDSKISNPASRFKELEAGALPVIPGTNTTIEDILSLVGEHGSNYRKPCFAER